MYYNLQEYFVRSFRTSLWSTRFRRACTRSRWQAWWLLLSASSTNATCTARRRWVTGELNCVRINVAMWWVLLQFTSSLFKSRVKRQVDQSNEQHERSLRKAATRSGRKSKSTKSTKSTTASAHTEYARVKGLPHFLAAEFIDILLNVVWFQRRQENEGDPYQSLHDRTSRRQVQR